MWQWHGGQCFLLALLVLCCSAILCSTVRFVRRRSSWPLSSPDSTRRPALIVAAAGCMAAWAVLHTIRAIFNEDMPCAAYVFVATIILQVRHTTMRMRKRNNERNHRHG